VTISVFVTILRWKINFFGDEPRSRRHFLPEPPFFGDEIHSRRHFKPKNSLFWRRDPFSSSFFCRNPHFLATRSILVVIFWPETPFFGDEIHSRRHFLPEPPFFGDEALSRRQFEAGNFTFWRRTPFSSPF
jgi:hypothetical protein